MVVLCSADGAAADLYFIWQISCFFLEKNYSKNEKIKLVPIIWQVFQIRAKEKSFIRLFTMENQFFWLIGQVLPVAYLTFPKSCAKGLNWNIEDPSQFILSSVIFIFTHWDRNCNIIRNSVICKKLLFVFSSRVQHVAAYLKT